MVLAKKSQGLYTLGDNLQQHVAAKIALFVTGSLRSWRYCVGARLKFWLRSRVPKKGSRDEAVEIPRISRKPSNLTRLYSAPPPVKIFVSTTEFCRSNMHVAKSQITLNWGDLLRRQNSVVETRIFAKILQYTRRDLSLRPVHKEWSVATTFRRNLSPSVFRPLSVWCKSRPDHYVTGLMSQKHKNNVHTYL